MVFQCVYNKTTSSYFRARKVPRGPKYLFVHFAKQLWEEQRKSVVCVYALIFGRSFQPFMSQPTTVCETLEA